MRCLALLCLMAVSLGCALSGAAADVVISEFMAANSATLADEDGDHPDWIEIHNSGANSFNLLDWGLTDNATKPFKWRFPETNIVPGGYVTVFASEKDRRVPGAPLHASFKLPAGGSYLGLVRPDGSIATQFSPYYPPQVTDVAFGFSAGIQRSLLLATGTVGRVEVPINGSLGQAWVTNGFNDTAWTSATNGLGFETGSSELGASLPEDVMADNPIGCWRLNGPTYTTMTNGGSLGSAANGTWNSDVQLSQPGALAGLANTAMRSSGTAGEKGTVPFLAALNPATSFTVEFWMKTELATGASLAPFYSRCGDDGYIVYIQGDGSLQFLQWIGTSWQAATTGPNTVSGMTNKWVHVTGVFDRTMGAFGTQFIYTNGVLAGTNALPGAFRNNTCGNFLIGFRNYQGGLDEMAVYGGALSPARILAHYQAGTNNLGNYVAAVQTDSPLAWWRFGEPAIPPSPGITANTGSLGTAVNGTLSGGVASTTTPMRPPTWPGLEGNNTCASFNSGQMTVPYNASLNPGAFTVECWARCTGNPGNYRGVMSCNWTSSNYTRRTGWNCFANSGNFWEFNVADGADFSGLLGPPVVLGEWIYLTATHDGSRLVLYANGLPVGTNVTGFFPNTNSAAVLRIGAANPWDSTWVSYFMGDLDEVAFFDYALSATDIARRYQVARSGKVAGTYQFAGLIQTDVQAAMLNQNSSLYARWPLVVRDPGAVDSLRLRLRYDDGFVAWLNGVPVASANAPYVLDWNAAAVTRSDTADALQFEEFSISDAQALLRPGTNVLAIQGLNLNAANSDFLLSAEVEAAFAGAYGTNAGYLLAPTPGGLNGAGSAAPGPSVLLVGHSPPLPTVNHSITVTCRVEAVLAPVASVTLNWRVMYGLTSQTPMLDDGAHGDGVAGDGVFGATIASTNYSVGQMVRWYVTAADMTNRVSRWPSFLDPANSPEYLGTMIADPSVASALPVWYWFSTNTSAAHTRNGARVSVFFNGQFYDNAFARERGQSASSGAQKFDFNPGDHCWINDEVGRVEELNLNTQGYADNSYTRPAVAFNAYRAAGHPASACFLMLLRANGGADRVGVFVEQVDERFLDRWGLDREGALYKFVNRVTLTPMLSDAIDGVEKKTRLQEDRSDLQAMCDALQQTNNIDARAAWMFDNLDLASFANGLAARVVTGSTDDRRKNIYFYRDTLGTREWTFFPWDMDWTFGGPYSPVDVHPFYSDHAHAGGANNEQWSYHYQALYNDPRTRQMIVRRMRTVMDQLLQPPGTANGWLESCADYWFAPAFPHLGTTVSNNVQSLKSKFPGRRNALYVTYSLTNTAAGINALIPQSQPTNLFVGIGAIEFNPASGNQDQEYVQIVNTNASAVDISGWKLGGAVQHTFKLGTVILPTNVMYCSPNIVAFRERSVSPKGGELIFAQGNYRGHLSAWGETLTLTDDRGRLVATNGFAPAPSDVQRYLRVTEIMYNPAPAPAIAGDAQQLEFVELRNISATVTLNLADVRFTNGIAFNFTGSAVISLAPGQRVLLVRNLAVFTSLYGSGLPVAGQFTGALDNGGETLRLEDATGEKVLEFAYNNSWYPITDGLGFSLVIVDDQVPWPAWDRKSSWRSSGVLGGAPGAGDSQPAVGGVLVNEVLAHTDPPARDSIELFNSTSTNIAIGGWFLTDDFYNPKKHRITNGTILNAGACLVLTDSQFNAGSSPFLLSEYGEEVYLFSGDASTNLSGYVHGFRFAESPNGVSFGRYVNSQTNTMFVLQSTNTLGVGNALPRVGPVVISEIMYRPPDLTNGTDNALGEFVELQNIAGTNVPLFCVFTNEPGYGQAARTNTWRLRDAVDFDFPTNVVLNAGSRLLIVGFNPSNAVQLADFRALYSVPTGTPIFGPWNGKLDNSGDTIELKYPDRPDVTVSNQIVPFVMVEKISYKEGAAWPSSADGTGQSLQRQAVTAFGNDPTNWFASTPTGGRANQSNQLPQVTLVAPTNSQVFQAPANVNITAGATDPDGFVAKVDFYSGSTWIGADDSQPYAVVWSNAPAGVHHLTARAIDDSGGSATSEGVLMTVLTAPPIVSLTSPAEGAVFVSGQSIEVSAMAIDGDGAVIRVDYYTNGFKAAESVGAPHVVTLTNLPSGLCRILAVATDNDGASSTSTVVTVAFGSGSLVESTLIATGAVWRFFDNGSRPDPAWFNPAYDDSGWSSGSAQFGYGNGGTDATTVSYGPNGSDKYPTTYFRRSFVVTNVGEITSLTALLKRDDGAVLYLNGTEAFRGGMPPGELDYGIYATETVGGNTKFNFTTNRLSPLGLTEGTNFVAVEIHQVTPGSSDLLFELQLDVVRTKAAPFLVTQPAHQAASLGGTATFEAEVLGPAPLSFQWKHAGTNLAGRTILPLILTNIAWTDAGEYVLVAANPNGLALSTPALLTVNSGDIDNDGMLDEWEVANGLVVGMDDAHLDKDGDGMTNLEEYVAGTQPSSASSALSIESCVLTSPQSLVLGFTAVSNRSYVLQTSADIPGSAWSSLVSIPAIQTNRTVLVTNIMDNTTRFYRLVIP